MKALIIDDEKKAKSLLKVFCDELCEDINEVYTADCLLDGVKKIKDLNPDIVFLDIEMPTHSGLEIFNFVEEPVNFQLIFTTAHQEYALEALKLSAVDYLLKPIDRGELLLAVDKAKTIIDQKKVSKRFVELKNDIKKLSLQKHALALPGEVIFFSYEHFKYFKADGMYTQVHLANGEVQIVRKPLIYFEKQFDKDPLIFRCHRSYLVNLFYVEKLVSNNGDFLMLKDKISVPISRNRKDSVLKLMKEIF